MLWRTAKLSLENLRISSPCRSMRRRLVIVNSPGPLSTDRAAGRTRVHRQRESIRIGLRTWRDRPGDGFAFVESMAAIEVDPGCSRHARCTRDLQLHDALGGIVQRIEHQRRLLRQQKSNDRNCDRKQSTPPRRTEGIARKRNGVIHGCGRFT